MPVHTTFLPPLHHVRAQKGSLIYQPSPSTDTGGTHGISQQYQMVVLALLFLHTYIHTYTHTHTHTHTSCPISGTCCHGLTCSYSWRVAVWKHKHSCLHPYHDPAMNYTAWVWLFANTLCLALPPAGHGTPVHASAISQGHHMAAWAHLFASTRWHGHTCAHASM